MRFRRRHAPAPVAAGAGGGSFSGPLTPQADERGDAQCRRGDGRDGDVAKPGDEIT